MHVVTMKIFRSIHVLAETRSSRVLNPISLGMFGETGSCPAASSILVWCPWKRSISDSSQTSISPLPSSSNFLKVAFTCLHASRTIPLAWRNIY